VFAGTCRPYYGVTGLLFSVAKMSQGDQFRAIAFGFVQAEQRRLTFVPVQSVSRRLISKQSSCTCHKFRTLSILTSSNSYEQLMHSNNNSKSTMVHPVSKGKSSKSARKESISNLRRKRFFILVKILLHRLERDDPEGFTRAKEVGFLYHVPLPWCHN